MPELVPLKMVQILRPLRIFVLCGCGKMGPVIKSRDYPSSVLTEASKIRIFDSGNKYPEIDEQDVKAITVDYEQLIAPLIKAVQELSAKIDSLETRVTNLE